jgi:hypothetical protein
MSGDGVISVRLPLSLLGAFRTAAAGQNLTIHEAARRLIAFISDLTQDELIKLKEPPHEFDSPRVSLYVGWRSIDTLTRETKNSALGNSNIFRRLFYGLFVTKELEFVQQNYQWKLRIVNRNNGEKSTFAEVEKEP